MPSALEEFLTGTPAERARTFDMTPEEFASLRPNIRNQINRIINSRGGPQAQNQVTPMPTAPLSGGEQGLVNRITSLGMNSGPARDLAGQQLRQTLNGQFVGQSPALTGVAGRQLTQTAGGQFQGDNPFAEGRAGAQLQRTIAGNFQGDDPFMEGVSGRNLRQTIQGQYLDPASNPFLASAIEAATRPVMEAYQDVTLPHLRDQFTLAGQAVQPNSSSPFEAQTLMYGRRAAQDVGDISSRIAAANYEAERQRQLQAAGLVSSAQSDAFQDERMRQLQAAGLVSGQQFEAYEAERQRQMAAAGLISDTQGRSFESERDRQMQAAAQVPALTESDIRQSVTALQAAGLPRLIEQMGLDQGNAEFQRRMQMLMQTLGLGAQVAQPTTGQIGGVSGSTGLLQEAASGGANAFLNPFFAALGQAGAGAATGALGSLFG